MFNTAYHYHLKEEQGIEFLIIIDDNQGMSLTNNIENVVEEIAQIEELDPNKLAIVYRDSQEVWDGWNNKKQEFIHLGSTSEARAIQKYIDTVKP